MDCQALDHIELTDSQEYAAQVDRLFLKQVENIRCVVDAVRKGVFGEFDPTRPIIVAGHSLGGAASVALAQIDPLIGGSINLDGGLKGNEQTRVVSLTQPLLTIRSDFTPSNDNAKKVVEDWETLHTHSLNSHLVQIQGTAHMDFTIFPLLHWLTGAQTGEGAQKALHVTSQEILKFLKIETTNPSC